MPRSILENYICWLPGIFILMWKWEILNYWNLLLCEKYGKSLVDKSKTENLVMPLNSSIYKPHFGYVHVSEINGIKTTRLRFRSWSSESNHQYGWVQYRYRSLHGGIEELWVVFHVLHLSMYPAQASSAVRLWSCLLRVCFVSCVRSRLRVMIIWFSMNEPED